MTEATPSQVLALYSGPLSLFTAKVRIALAEKGLAYERIEVGWTLEDRYLPHHPQVARHNPRGQVPVLVHGDVVVWDSTLIVEYLEERFKEAPALLPVDPAARASARQLELTADEIVFPHVWDLIESRFYPTGVDATARAAAAEAGLATCADDLEAALGDAEYFTSRDAFGCADIALVVMLQTAVTLGAPLPERCKGLVRWRDRCVARPAVAAEFAAMTAYVAGLSQRSA